MAGRMRTSVSTKTRACSVSDRTSWRGPCARRRAGFAYCVARTPLLSWPQFPGAVSRRSLYRATWLVESFRPGRLQGRVRAVCERSAVRTPGGLSSRASFPQRIQTRSMVGRAGCMSWRTARCWSLTTRRTPSGGFRQDCPPADERRAPAWRRVVRYRRVTDTSPADLASRLQDAPPRSCLLPAPAPRSLPGRTPPQIANSSPTRYAASGGPQG